MKKNAEMLMDIGFDGMVYVDLRSKNEVITCEKGAVKNKDNS